MLTNKRIKVLFKLHLNLYKLPLNVNADLEVHGNLYLKDRINFWKLIFQLLMKHNTKCMRCVGIGTQSSPCKVLADAVYLIFSVIP